MARAVLTSLTGSLTTARLADTLAHLADGYVSPAKTERATMLVADVELDDLADGGERADVAVGEPVAGGDT